jgi:hypothetical protein
MLDQELLEILACPKCKGDLQYDAGKATLTCQNCKLIYRVEEDIPYMLIEEADSFYAVTMAVLLQ